MMKSILLALGLTVSLSAPAATINDVVVGAVQNILSDVGTSGVFDWKVGDSASYNLKMSIINGKMVMTVKDVQPSEVTFTQDMDLGFAGKQSCEMKLDPNTGETKSIVCNGQPQDPGDAGDVEIVETSEKSVTVPAGTFTCLYIKAQQKGQNGFIEQWANPKQVPVMGMVKTVAPSQMGSVTLELTSFKKN